MIKPTEILAKVKNVKVKSAVRIVVPIAVVAGSVLLSAFILMLLWNSFLVAAVGVSTISLWQAVLGWIFIYFLTAMVTGARQIARFVQMALVSYVVNRQVQKQIKEMEGEMATQNDLAKHFGFPFGGNEQDNS